MDGGKGQRAGQHTRHAPTRKPAVCGVWWCGMVCVVVSTEQNTNGGGYGWLGGGMNEWRPSVGENQTKHGAFQSWLHASTHQHQAGRKAERRAGNTALVLSISLLRIRQKMRLLLSPSPLSPSLSHTCVSDFLSLSLSLSIYLSERACLRFRDTSHQPLGRWAAVCARSGQSVAICPGLQALAGSSWWGGIAVPYVPPSPSLSPHLALLHFGMTDKHTHAHTDIQTDA